MAQINVVMKSLDELTPYEENPRKNDDAVKFVAESISEFGFKVPIVVDAFGVIVAGHTRYKAAKKLKLKEVPCVVADDLTEEQIKAFRLADNKTAEFAEWDLDLLGKELAGIEELDMSRFGFNLDDGLGEELDDEKYTFSSNIPQYEITGEKPTFEQMLDHDRAVALVERVDAALEKGSITPEEAAFLRAAAQRHNVFNYRHIAEYYAQATPEMQELMEESALVIIDVNSAIANGFASLDEGVREMMGAGADEE